MITDISSYKAIFFDFDDTLCIHNSRNRESGEEYNTGVVSGSYSWQDCAANRSMKKFIELAETHNVPMYLISATCSSVHANAKIDWVLRNYGVTMGNYCVGKRKGKLKMLKAYSNAHDFSRKEILFIDDCWESIHEAEQNGFHACSPMEIVNYIDNIDK